MNYNEALAINNSTNITTGIRRTGACYWLASANTGSGRDVWYVNGNGGMDNYRYSCWGVRPIVSLTSGVYIKSGTGTEADPYILEKTRI